jgi:phosphopantothenoylcysteine decarboxylase/phosphopantothenate--cysteine ligase
MSNLLFILSGSISCYKACDAISQLVQKGHAVRAVATAAALKFVGPATLEGLTRHKVLTDLFAEGEALEHIDLSRWADLTVVCPATANTLSRMAAGFADDLAGAILLAHDRRKPLLVAPAMNPAMWSHPATEASVSRLRERGVCFIAPGLGRTACGEVGEGRLAEPDVIVSAVTGALEKRQGLRVLITSGGTVEPIDGVRVLANTSTGATGARLADHFSRRGHRVTLLRAQSAVSPFQPCTQETFFSFADLDAALRRLLGDEDFDAVIHAAAVSDYHVAAIEADGARFQPGAGKMSSSAAEATLTLRPNPKLLDDLRRRSRNARVAIVAFKLTRDASAAEAKAAVERLFAAGAVDFVVHNDVSEKRTTDDFPATIWSQRAVVSRSETRTQLANEIERVLLENRAPIATPPDSAT